MSKHKLMLLGAVALVAGGAYYVHRKGGLTNVKADLLAHYGVKKAAVVPASTATAAKAPLAAGDDKETEL